MHSLLIAPYPSDLEELLLLMTLALVVRPCLSLHVSGEVIRERLIQSIFKDRAISRILTRLKLQSRISRSSSASSIIVTGNAQECLLPNRSRSSIPHDVEASRQGAMQRGLRHLLQRYKGVRPSLPLETVTHIFTFQKMPPAGPPTSEAAPIQADWQHYVDAFVFLYLSERSRSPDSLYDFSSITPSPVLEVMEEEESPYHNQTSSRLAEQPATDAFVDLMYREAEGERPAIDSLEEEFLDYDELQEPTADHLDQGRKRNRRGYGN